MFQQGQQIIYGGNGVCRIEEIVLREISRRFERNRDYPEPEVNAIISEIYDDFCTVRREMIGCGIMTRHPVKGGFDMYRLV